MAPRVKQFELSFYTGAMWDKVCVDNEREDVRGQHCREERERVKL